MTQQERFGQRLRQLRREKSAREERDVEQSEVAAAVGDTQPNVARWERGRIPRDDDTLKRLAAFYGVEMVWLRYGTGPRTVEEPPRVALPDPHLDRKLTAQEEARAVRAAEQLDTADRARGRGAAKKKRGGNGAA